MKLTRIILYFLIGFWVAQFAFYFGNLPEIVASHFNAAGEPDGWMSKSSFAIFEAVILLLIAAEFTVLPLLLEKTPDSLINLPNKAFWLAAERRSETFAVIRSNFEWLAVILLVLFIAVNQMVFQANTQNQNLPEKTVIIVLALFFAFVIVWMWKFTGYFRNLKNI